MTVQLAQQEQRLKLLSTTCGLQSSSTPDFFQQEAERLQVKKLARAGLRQ